MSSSNLCSTLLNYGVSSYSAWGRTQEFVQRRLILVSGVGTNPLTWMHHAYWFKLFRNHVHCKISAFCTLNFDDVLAKVKLVMSIY